MRLALLASLLLVSASGAALASEDTERNQAKPVKEKKICRDSGDRTESRMRKRVCKTAEQWENSRSGASDADLKRLGN